MSRYNVSPNARGNLLMVIPAEEGQQLSTDLEEAATSLQNASAAFGFLRIALQEGYGDVHELAAIAELCGHGMKRCAEKEGVVLENLGSDIFMAMARKDEE